MKTRLSVAILAALSVLGCKGNSICTIGYQSCFENKAQLCVGADQGGDADGEFKVIDDCAKQGLFCGEDHMGPFVGRRTSPVARPKLAPAPATSSAPSRAEPCASSTSTSTLAP
jgi:hypothetical protein